MMTAKWIAPQGIKPDEENCYYRVWREFELSQVPGQIELQVACEGWYRLEINRRYACRGPVRGSKKVAYVDSLDVASWLREGVNRIEALVRYTNRAEALFNVLVPGFWLKLGYFLGSDSSWQMELCKSEWPSQVPWFSVQNGYCEWHDLRHVDDSLAVACIELPPDSPVNGKRLVVHETPLAEECSCLPTVVVSVARVPAADWEHEDLSHLNTFEPHLPAGNELATALYELTLAGSHHVELPPTSDGQGLAVTFDFSHEMTGRIEFEITAPAGTVADISYEEELWQDGRVHSDHTHTNPTYRFCDRVILAEGRNLVGNYLVDRGYRLVQLTLRNFASPVVLHRVRGINRRYPLGERADFFCGDYKLNRLWNVCKETLSACVTDIYTDCPWRERLFYINDMVVENRTMLSCFGDWRLARYAFDVAMEEMEEDDLITSSCPGKRTSPFAVILSANLTLVITMYEYWMHSGDRETVCRYYPKLLRIMNRFASWRQADGSILPPDSYWNFFDWSFELNGSVFTGKKSSLLNYLFVMAGRRMLELALVANKPAPMTEAELDDMCRNTRSRFISKELGLLLDGTDCDASFAVLKELGIPTPRHRDEPVSRLAQAFAILAEKEDTGPLEQHLLDESRLTPEFYYLSFILSAMEKCGLYEALLHTIQHYWGQVLDSGSPTIWENGLYDPGKAGFGGSASLCHGFSTGPAYFIQRCVLGVCPLEAGFRRFKFQPRFSSMSFARGRVPTPCGAILVDWKYQDGTYTASLTVPPDCLAVTPAGSFGEGRHLFSWQ